MDEYYGFVELAGAILKLAADDYIKALEENDEKSMKKRKSLERFFLSDWGQMLSLHQGEAIIRNCKLAAERNKCDDLKQNE